MNFHHLSKNQKLTVSAMVMALYIAILYATQSISFGPVQIRIATTLYALSYHCPFLILPLGLANLISNFLGGLGAADIIGGCVVGIVTSVLVAAVRRYRLPIWLCAVPIIIIPGFGVAIWLSVLFHLPYLPLAGSLCLGQAVPAFCGVLLIQALERSLFRKGVTA